MIEKFFTEAVVVTRKTRSQTNGVWKETFTTAWSGNVAFDKSQTSSIFTSNKESFDYSAVVYAPLASGIIEDDILTYGSIAYDVVSSVNPMNRNNHIEVALKKRAS